MSTIKAYGTRSKSGMPFPGWNNLSDAQKIEYNEKAIERERERKETAELSRKLLEEREREEALNTLKLQETSKTLPYVIIKNNNMLQLINEVNEYIGNMYDPIGNVYVDSGMFYQALYRKDTFGGTNNKRMQSRTKKNNRKR